jgi:hypothetical protein
MKPDVNKYGVKDLPDILPDDLLPALSQRDGAEILGQELPLRFSPGQVSHTAGEEKTLEQRIWELIGLFYMTKERWQPYDALHIFSQLYNHQQLAQTDYRVHKGVPLLWMYECFLNMGYPVHAKRYLMLTLCETAINTKGEIDPEESGVYFRLVWKHGLSDFELKRYARCSYELFQKHPQECLFPEWVLQNLDQDWMTEFPSISESSHYQINQLFAKNMVNGLGEKSGKVMEKLARYLLSCIPGCRTYIRQKSYSTDYDVVCSLEGHEVDFRSQFGRYFICECKDWKKPVDYSTIAKFCRVLDTTKCQFGIIFSRKGITGKGKALFGEREQIKVYQDRGMVIVVIDINDLKAIAKGANFISVLRSKYEKVRLDLIDQ